MKTLLFIFFTLFISYKVAGIGGLILSIIPLVLLLSMIANKSKVSSSLAPENAFEYGGMSWSDHNQDQPGTMYVSSEGAGVETWDGQPWTPNAD